MTNTGILLRGGRYNGYDDLGTVGVVGTGGVGVFRCNKSVSLSEIIDGASNTVLIGETVHKHFRFHSGYASSPMYVYVGVFDYTPTWGAGRNGAVVGGMKWYWTPLPLNRAAKDNPAFVALFSGADSSVFAADPANALTPPYTYSSRHPAGANFLMADGSVAFIENQIAFPVYVNLGTIAGLD